MVHACVVCKRVYRLNRNLSFHRFPQDPERRRVWFSLVGIAEDQPLPKNPELCCDHFFRDDIIYKSNGIKYIRKGATPRRCEGLIFLDDVPSSCSDSCSESTDEAVSLIDPIEPSPLSPVLTTSTPSIEFKLNPSKLVTINKPIQLLPSNQVSPQQHILLTPYRQYGPILSKPLPKESQGVQSRSPLSDSSTDTASESGDHTTLLTDRFGEEIEEKPNISFLSAQIPSNSVDQIKEEYFPGRIEYPQLRQIEPTVTVPPERIPAEVKSEPPFLTHEMMVCRKKNVHLTKKRFFGDITIDDYQTDEEKQEFIRTEKLIRKGKKKIHTIKNNNNRLRARLTKINSIIDMVASVCDISHIKKCLADEGSSNESSSSSDEDVLGGEEDNAPWVNMDPEVYVKYEQNETQIDSFDVANQVQVTFSAGIDTANENMLKKELEERARRDIRRSKKIKLLNNAIFMKNSVINDLENELEELKNT